MTILNLFTLNLKNQYMKIKSIIIFDRSSEQEIGTLKNDDEILKVFKPYRGISPDDIFEFKDSVYVTEE